MEDFQKKREEREMTNYRMKILLSNIIITFVFVLVGIFSNNTINAIVYLAILFSLRRWTSGYHCKTVMGCFIVTNILFGFILLLNIIIDNELKTLIGIVLIFYSMLEIFYSKTVVNENKYINKNSFHNYVSKKNVRVLIISMIGLIHYIFLETNVIPIRYNFLFIIGATLLVIAISMKKGGKYDEEVI